MVDFTKLLDTVGSEVVRPPLMPLGTYLWMNSAVPECKTVGQGDRWNIIEFKMKCISPSDDVSVDELAEYGSVAGQIRTIRFMFDSEETPEAETSNDKTMWSLRRFITEHLEVEWGDETLKTVLQSTINASCYGAIKYRPDKNDPENVYDEIGTTTPAS